MFEPLFSDGKSWKSLVISDFELERKFGKKGKIMMFLRKTSEPEKNAFK